VNLLIIGGLMALALLAVLGIVFLALGESRAQAAARPTSSPRTTRRLEPEPQRAAEAPASITQTFSGERTIPLRPDTGREERQLPALNGQFHELAAELRTLYQQAWELEQRLRVLTQTVDRIEGSPSGRINIEEEEGHPSPDSTLP